MENSAPIPFNDLSVPTQRAPHNDDGALDTDGCRITSLTPIAVQNDSENEMWNMYLDEVKEEDQRMTDAWKQDAKGILVFVSLDRSKLILVFVPMTNSKTGLFSATVGAFIIEFYKQLPNSKSDTANQPSPRSSSMIWVNAMWLTSLVFSLTSALVATLLQQWARMYIEAPKVRSQPKDRAHIRSFLFHGTELYKMRILIEIAPTLLHLSVLLFFAGLVITFHTSTITIHTEVAIAVDVAVGFFGLAYIMLSILPCHDVRCPYRTPMSVILWHPWHAFLAFTAHCLYWVMKQLHQCLVPPTLEGPMSLGQRIFVGWLNSREDAFKRHWQYFINGFRASVITGATSTPDRGERKLITGLFSELALGDKGKLRKFAARIPRDRVLDLIPPIDSESGKFVLREPLLVLLRSCAEGTRAAVLDKDVRKSLLVCLDAIHHTVKAPTIPDLNFMRANFADVGLMRPMLVNTDTVIRIISRTICTLVARQVIRGPLEEPELRWLQELTGEASNTIFNANTATRDRMNFKSFVYGTLSSPIQAGDFPTKTFKETLAILLDVRTVAGDQEIDVHFDLITSRNRLSEEVGWLQQDDLQRSYAIVDRLRSESMFPFLPPPFPIPINQPAT